MRAPAHNLLLLPVLPDENGSQTIGGFYKLSHDDEKWEFDPDPSWDDRSINWWSTKQVTETFQKFHLPMGTRPPYGGVASHWYKNPAKWEWIGGMNWQCVSGPDTIFFQSFERGKLIGPLRKSSVLNAAQVVVILDDHSYHLVDFDGKIPPCGAPEQP